jgi:hypothetical protein
MSTQQAQQVPQGALTNDAIAKLLVGDFDLIPASGALPVNLPGRYLITKGGVAALTLAAPALADDGMRCVYISNTAQAHTITATGLYRDGAGHVNLATFAAQIGASLTLMALGGKWFVLGANGVTLS